MCKVFIDEEMFSSHFQEEMKVILLPAGTMQENGRKHYLFVLADVSNNLENKQFKLIKNPSNELYLKQ